jgi:hypothetical protein
VKAVEYILFSWYCSVPDGSSEIQAFRTVANTGKEDRTLETGDSGNNNVAG